MFLLTLTVIGLLLLAFKATRLTGIAGLTLLALVYPKLFLALLFISGVTLLFIYLLRRKNHEFPKLPIRRD